MNCTAGLGFSRLKHRTVDIFAVHTATAELGEQSRVKVNHFSRVGFDYVARQNRKESSENNKVNFFLAAETQDSIRKLPFPFRF